MRTRFTLLVLVAALPVLLSAQPQPQNARQALLETLFGKPGSFERHLPKATIAALRQANPGGPSPLDQLSMLSVLARAPGSQLQTFETGSTLLLYSDDRTQSKFEVNIENDDLRGDEDEIQLSFQGSKEGQPIGAPVMPTVSVLMKQEAGLWKLNTISVTVRVPLADPEFLKALVTSMKQRSGQAAGLGSIAVGPSLSSAASGQPRVNEASALASMQTLVTAEVAYSVTYPAHGFTCTLSDLDGFGSDTPNETHAMLIESGLAGGRKGGYVFALTGCTGSPSTRFQLVAVPATAGAGARAFCSDQSGMIRYSADGQAASCLTSGKPVQ